MVATDKNFHTEFSFVLNCFTPEDIECIASDLKMSFDDHHFLYIIDTYDIVENYLPYTDMELFAKKDFNYQSQKFICYDYFFGSFNKTDSILLEEYKLELLAAKNKLNRHLGEAKTVLSNLHTLKTETNHFLDDPERTESFLRNNFEIILLLLILNDKTNTILDDFFSFIKTRLQVSEIRGNGGKDMEKLNAIFSACTHTRFSVSVFERYIQENKLKLLSVNKFEERRIFLENTFRDIQVIERIIRINEALANSNLKYYAIYLSSAHKTRDLFKIFNKLTGASVDNKADQAKNIHRTIYQYFLYDRLRKEFDGNLEGALEILNSLKTLVSKLSSSQSLITYVDQQKDKDVLNVFQTLFDEKSGTIDNHFYLSIYERYKDTFQRMADPHRTSSLNKEEVLKIIKEVDRNKSQQEARIFNLDFALSQLNQAFDMVDTFQGMDDYEPEYRYGRDIVRNPYHHLPVLLLIHEKYDSPLKTKLYSFLNTNVEFKENEKNVIKNKFRELVSQIPLLDSNDVPSKILKSIIITYINFIAQPKLKSKNLITSGGLSLEEAIIIDLEKQYEITKLQFERIDFAQKKQNEKLSFIVSDTQLLYEIAYVLLWLYRRNNRASDGIRLGKEILYQSKSDARIYQGVALCYVSTLYSLIKGDSSYQEIQKYLQFSLQYLRCAKEQFQLLINANYELDRVTLVMKNYIALLNSLADVLLRKYEIENKKDPSLVKEARACINEIKALFDTINLIYDDHPTYSATEFEIEYFEAQLHYDVGEFSRAHQKIINALARVSILKKHKNVSQYVDGLFLKKEKNLNELSSAIFQHYAKNRL